jgi:hypothetical protein
MKFSELNSTQRETQIQSIGQDWELNASWRKESLDTITKYLFTLNSGGLLASLAYLAAKKEVDGVNILIGLFFLGTLFVVLRAAIDYYASEKRLASLRDDINDLYFDNIEVEKYTSNVRQRANSNDCLLHVFGWLSGILFFTSIAIGAFTIQPKAEPSGGINSEAAPLRDTP